MNAIEHVQNFNQIVKGVEKMKGPPISIPGLPPGCVVSHEITFLTVDSGACDNIMPPHMFKNTPTIRHSEFGKQYAACGGETVTNIGVKNVRSLLDGNASYTNWRSRHQRPISS